MRFESRRLSGHRAAGRFDRRLGARRGKDALEHHRRRQFTRLDDLHDFCKLADQTGLLQRQDVDLADAQLLQIGQADLGVELQQVRLETALRQATLQRHLAAFEADLVVAARTRLLALVAAARGLAQTGADATTDAATRLLGAFARLDGVEFHVLVLGVLQSTLTRYETLLIMPRTAGVSSRVDSLFSLRRPRPRTVARCDSRVPLMLRTSLIFTICLSAMMVLRNARFS